VAPKRPRSRLLHRQLQHLRRNLPRGKRFVDRAIALNSQAAKPQLPADIRRQLVAEYRSDIQQLQAALGRDLSGWLQ